MPTAAVNGTELSYLDDGPVDAPAIVFSHSLFFNSSMFQAQADRFAGTHRVIRYDQRGQGASAAAPADQLDMDTLADDAAALIEHLGIAPCHFVGNSMGGFVALRLAARRPDLLRSATVIGSSAEEEHKLAEFQPLVDSLAENGTAPAIDVLMHIMFGDTFLADPDRAEEREAWRNSMLALAPRIADAANGVIHRQGVLDELSGADVPILVLACAEDHAYELALSENIAAAAPLARLEVVPGSGHSGALEAPEVVNEHLGTLIHQVDSAVGAASVSAAESYEQACAEHKWVVPERYNIAADVCDKHPREKLAMIHEHFAGDVREVHWGELQDMAAQAANVLAAAGVQRGDRVALVLPPTPETAALFIGVWKLGAILLSMSVLYGDDGIQHRLTDSQAKVLVTDADNVDRFSPEWVEQIIVLDKAMLDAASTEFESVDTSADDPAQLYYTSGTTGLAKGIVHAHRYLLAHEEFIYCHEVEESERFHGMGEWAWAAGISPLLGPWRLGAVQMVYQREGGFDPHKQLDFLSRHEVTNVFTTPTAMRSMMTIEDAGSRYPQRFRRVCSAGEPLNPEAIRWFRSNYGLTVLDYYGLTESYPLCANFPFMEVREGSMGKPMPGWDVQILDEDENPVKRGERGEICLRTNSNPHFPLGYWNNPEAGEETFGGNWFHSKDAATQDEDGYVWYAGRADDVIIAAGYRIGPFEVESACLEHPAVQEAAAVASPDERRGHVVKGFIVLAEGHEGTDELADEIKAFVRDRLSAYAYPRRIEFVPDLPKTLTGKIRRVELREQEAEARALGTSPPRSA